MWPDQVELIVVMGKNKTLKGQVSEIISRVCRKEFVDTWSQKSYNFSAMLIKTAIAKISFD